MSRASTGGHSCPGLGSGVRRILIGAGAVKYRLDSALAWWRSAAEPLGLKTKSTELDDFKNEVVLHFFH